MRNRLRNPHAVQHRTPFYCDIVVSARAPEPAGPTHAFLKRFDNLDLGSIYLRSVSNLYC